MKLIINRIMNSIIKPITVFGLLLVISTVIMEMQSFAESAANVNTPGTVTTWGGGSSSPPIPVVFPAGVVPVSISAYEYKGGLAISQDGSLYEWFGVLDAVPTLVTLPASVSAVYAVSKRWAHTLAITNDGLYAWGDNHKGQLGDGTTINHLTPEKVIFPPSVTNITEIAAGYLHSLAITNDGLYAWGDNWNGELGIGTRINQNFPVKVVFPYTVTTVSHVSAGRNSSYAITNDGLYAWGNDFAGQLGNGSFGILPNGDSDIGQMLPVKVLFNVLPNTKKGNGTVTSVTGIAAGPEWALAITNDGLYAWGMNTSGNLGTGVKSIDGNQSFPAKVKLPKAVTSVTVIDASVGNGFAVTNDGLYGWGANYFGQLGVNQNSYSLTPVKIPGEGNAIDVGAAEYSTIALH